MGTSVERVIYATDAAQPAARRPFRRLVPEDLPDGASDVRIRVFRTRPPYQLGFSPGLWSALRGAIPSADLVTIHSVNLFPQYAAFTAALRARVPYIVTPHGALNPWFAANRRLVKTLTNAVWQRRMLKHAAAIHFTTDEEASLAGDLTASTPHVIIPNGLDLSRFAVERSGHSFREQHLDGNDAPLVLFLGRIARVKGIDLLIRAFAHVTSTHHSYLVIAGPDDESLTPELASIADAERVSDRIRFVGPLYNDDQLSALAAADVWALTSHAESFGNAVVEAMAAGCPVLVSANVNLARQIRSADAGIVTNLSVEEIASALRALLDSPERRAGLRPRARALAQHFDWSLIAPELVRTFRELVEAQSSAERQ